MKVLVCGGRDYTRWDVVKHVLDSLDEERGVECIIQGGARGADFLSSEWAKLRRKREERYPADWVKHGRSAGYIRNHAMLHTGNPDMVVAFPGGKGTANMVKLAYNEGIFVKKVSEEEARQILNGEYL